jgi:protein translocase SecG subunit
VLTFFIVTLSLALVAVSLFSILVIVMQKSPDGGGFGSSLGSGAMESIFGGDAADLLVRTTTKAAVAFLVISMLLSMCCVRRAANGDGDRKIHLPEQHTTVKAPPESRGK